MMHWKYILAIILKKEWKEDGFDQLNLFSFLLDITAFGYRITDNHFHSMEVSEVIGNIVISIKVFEVELYTGNASEKWAP